MFLSSISNSKLSTYNECPHKFKLKYYDRVDEGDTNKDAFQFGSYIHKIFEEGYKESSLEDLTSIATKLRSQYQFSESLEDDIEKCLKNFLKLNSSLARTVSTEQYFTLDLGDNIVFNGIIDRIIESKSGDLLVIDYKTNKREKLKKDLLYDDQLLGYTFAVSKLYNKQFNNISVALYYPKTGNLCGPVKYSNMHVALYLKKLKEACWKIRKKKKDEFRPTQNKFCDWCAYKNYCPVFTPNAFQNLNEHLKTRNITNH